MQLAQEVRLIHYSHLIGFILTHLMKIQPGVILRPEMEVSQRKIMLSITQIKINLRSDVGPQTWVNNLKKNDFVKFQRRNNDQDYVYFMILGASPYLSGGDSLVLIDVSYETSGSVESFFF